MHSWYQENRYYGSFANFLVDVIVFAVVLFYFPNERTISLLAQYEMVMYYEMLNNLSFVQVMFYWLFVRFL